MSILDLIRAAIEDGAGTPARPLARAIVGQRASGVVVSLRDARAAVDALLQSGRLWYAGTRAVLDED